MCAPPLLWKRQHRHQREQYLIVDSKLQTIYSNNIRNNFGFLNRGDESGIGQPDKLFVQEGRKVFKEVCPAVAAQISQQLEALDIRRNSSSASGYTRPTSV